METALILQRNNNLELATLFIVCFIFSLLINFILLRFSQTLGIRNREVEQIRWNPNVKPALGGISFYVVFLFGFIFTVILQHNEGINLKLVGVLIAATLAFLMGLADDAFNTQPLLKFLTQIFCGLVLIFSQHSIHIFQNQFLDYLLTIFWVVGMMNSINMLDNMDGITTIVAIWICAFMFLVNVSLQPIQTYSSILNLAMLGALGGFLVYNFHPSKMFMGDTGSQFLGLFLAVMGIDNCWNNAAVPFINGFPLVNVLMVCLVFLLPFTDTVTVVINRLWAGNSPFVGGKDHTTHYLFFRGISEKKIALLYFIIGASATIMAYYLTVHFSFSLFYVSATFAGLVFLSLYLNTIIKRR